jgi:hypothetical protein
MSFKNAIPKNYYCFFNQTNLQNTDWEVTKNVSQGISTYFFNMDKDWKEVKRNDNRRHIVYEQGYDWET